MLSLTSSQAANTMRNNKSRVLAAVALTAAFFCCGAAVQALWIPLKAGLAQVLLQRSWEQGLDGAIDARPWPWADTHAIALLQVPRLNVRQIVLAGSSGRNLAFGPTLDEASLAMEDWVISGHRDTHFRFVEELQKGDRLQLETLAGQKTFEVDSLEIIDSRKVELVIDPAQSRLSLVTCYPFDAARAGGPLRYVVTAIPLEEPEINRRSVSSG